MVWFAREPVIETVAMLPEPIDEATSEPVVSDQPRILFGSDRDGDHEIYVMNADGSGVVQLTDNAISDGWPVWSPDGSRIAFRSDRDGDFEIYVMNADGSGVVQLTDNSHHDTIGGWSPDSRRIVYESDWNGGGVQP